MAKMKRSNNLMKNINPENQGPDWYYLIPLAMIGAIVPTIVYLKVVPLPPHVAQFWMGDTNADFFSYYKAIWIQILTAISLITLLLAKVQNAIEFKKDKIFIPLAVYAVFVILSAVFADSVYREVAFKGYPDRYEGMYVLLSYVLITFIAAHIVRTENHLKLVLGSLLASASVLSVLGVFQYLGYDFFRSEFGRTLIIPEFYESIRGSIDFAFGTNAIYSTMYNTNYVGSYMVMIVIITMVLFLFSRNQISNLLYGSILILTFSNLIGSNSRAGLVGFLFTLIIMIIFMYEEILRNWRKVLLIVLVPLLVVGLIDYTSGGRVASNIKNLSLDVRDMLNAVGKQYDEPEEPKRQAFNNMYLNGNKATIDMTTESIQVQTISLNQNLDYDISDFAFYDTDGIRLTTEQTKNANTITFNESNYNRYNVLVIGNLVQVNIGRVQVNLGVDDQGNIKYMDRNLQLVYPIDAPNWGFSGLENLGSNRGYIWSRSIPMLKETIILGNGPDTFPIYFPQDDYIAKMKYVGSPHRIVDKPHNLYLQKSINTGFISLLAFLTFVGMYLFKSIRNYNASKEKQKENEKLRKIATVNIGIALSVIAYLISAIFNDSIVSVAPVFWLLIGVGVACNYMHEYYMNITN
ncbi:O-antigen ligase family protein [Desulfuribacillus alkaliarsenatis]|uniref:O-antigen polymerase n=1 Tax=Desulfuribacillus alkaliarsenatis TaxID=766136 RepID=A0A1E5G2Q4_9FIRM|nr:O-antigen ligase family protein [Desulfuribacillus alkaliarsenatis]OEF96811.1 hypothetical protein BHF68_07050 [Desulfuribacillus alkaliarsenatis]